MSVDIAARKQYAELLRQFMSGRMTNDDFVSREPIESDDAAICAISEQAWFLYDDIRTHRLSGRWRITGDGRHAVARWILFLKTDLEYTWPPLLRGGPLFQYIFQCLITFGAAIGERRRTWECAGDRDVWPFAARSDYVRALQHETVFSRAA